MNKTDKELLEEINGQLEKLPPADPAEQAEFDFMLPVLKVSEPVPIKDDGENADIEKDIKDDYKLARKVSRNLVEQQQEMTLQVQLLYLQNLVSVHQQLETTSISWFLNWE